MRTLILYIFILILFSCNTENKTDTTVISNARGVDSVGFDNSLITEDLLIKFSSYADTLIMKALNKNILDFQIKIDSQFQSTYLAFFDSDGFHKKTKYEFKLERPYSQYSFRLTEYEYSSISEAKDVLERLTTILCVSAIGLNKEPTDIFRINNSIFWFNTPHTLSGSSFKKLNNKLISILKDKKHRIDSYSDNYTGIRYDSIIDLKILGDWKLVYYSKIYENDTARIKNYDNSIVKFNKTNVIIDTIKYGINNIGVIELPDFKAFLQYQDFVHETDLNIHKQLKPLKGDMTWYRIYFDMKDFLTDIKYRNEIFIALRMNNLIRMPNDKIGLIINGKLYELVRINAPQHAVIKHCSDSAIFERHNI